MSGLVVEILKGEQERRRVGRKGRKQLDPSSSYKVGVVCVSVCVYLVR